MRKNILIYFTGFSLLFVLGCDPNFAPTTPELVDDDVVNTSQLMTVKPLKQGNNSVTGGTSMLVNTEENERKKSSIREGKEKEQLKDEGVEENNRSGQVEQLSTNSSGNYPGLLIIAPVKEQTDLTQVTETYRAGEKFLAKEGKTINFYEFLTNFDRNVDKESPVQDKRKLNEEEKKLVKFKRRKILTKWKEKMAKEEEEEPLHRNHLIRYQNLLAYAVKGDMEAQFNLGKEAYEAWQQQRTEDAAQEAESWLLESSIQGYQPAITLLEKLKSECLTKQKYVCQEDLPILSPEVWAYILSYIKYPEVLSAMQVNQCFYTLITGGISLGVVGVNNKTKPIVITSAWAINKIIDFNKEKLKRLTPETIPSFFFYQLMGRVKSLPQEFWPHLKEAKLYTVDLSGSKIKVIGAIKLAQYLQGTKVHTVCLRGNNIDDVGLGEFARTLQRTNVHTIDLDYNQIGNNGVADFARNLQGTQIHTISLGNNRSIGASGLIEFAQNLQGTMVREVRLLQSKIDNKTKELLKQQFPHIKWII